MKITTAHQYSEIESAFNNEMGYLNRNGIPLNDGSIGIESLGEEDGYAYASKGGYGNMASYISFACARDELARTRHFKQSV